jgi:hypothetical protein
VPLPDRSKALTQRVDGKRLRVVGQVARNAVGARRQEASPLDLEMPNGRLVAAPRVIAGRFEIAVNIRHRA